MKNCNNEDFDILKNVNLDELLNYINSNHTKEKEKKKSKKKKKNKNGNICIENIDVGEIKKNSTFYDKEIEKIKQILEKGNKKASETFKIKPILSNNWIEKFK